LLDIAKDIINKQNGKKFISRWPVCCVKTVEINWEFPHLFWKSDTRVSL